MALDPSIFDQPDLSALAARAGEPIVTDQDEQEARHALASVWELVKHHGSPKWSLETAPAIAKQILIEAAARLWMNLGGYVTERADSVSLGRSEDFARGASLTDSEIKRLEEASGKHQAAQALRTVPLTNPIAPYMRSGGNSFDWTPLYTQMFLQQAREKFPHLPQT